MLLFDKKGYIRGNSFPIVSITKKKKKIEQIKNHDGDWFYSKFLLYTGMFRLAEWSKGWMLKVLGINC